jgi:hypothetical protein
MHRTVPRIPSREEIREILAGGHELASHRNTPAASEYSGIVDALHRFGAGQDLRDRDLFESAFAVDATLDFTGPAPRIGAAMPVLVGRQAIADAIFANTGALDTTHVLTRPRVTALDGGRVTLSALVEVQHRPRNDHGRHLLLKNLYTADLSRQGGRWVIEALRISNLQLTGDPSVLFPKATVAAPTDSPENPHA